MGSGLKCLLFEIAFCLCVNTRRQALRSHDSRENVKSASALTFDVHPLNADPRVFSR